MAKRRTDGPLTASRIHAAALELIDREGIDALTMRRLGAELGVDPMAVYHHVPNKEAVLHGVVRTVFEAMPVPALRGSWQSRLRTWARAYRAVVMAHPNLVIRIATDRDTVLIAAAAANVGLVDTLQRAGFQGGTVDRAADLVVDYVNGAALAHASTPRDPRGDAALLADLDAAFEFGLRIVVAGLEATLR